MTLKLSLWDVSAFATPVAGDLIYASSPASDRYWSCKSHGLLRPFLIIYFLWERGNIKTRVDDKCNLTVRVSKEISWTVPERIQQHCTVLKKGTSTFLTAVRTLFCWAECGTSIALHWRALAARWEPIAVMDSSPPGLLRWHKMTLMVHKGCRPLLMIYDISPWHPLSCHLAQNRTCVTFEGACMNTAPCWLSLPQGHWFVTIIWCCQQQKAQRSQKVKWCQFNQRGNQKHTDIHTQKPLANKSVAERWVIRRQYLAGQH